MSAPLRWSDLQEGSWYKGIMRDSINGFEPKDKVWIKINDELPWRGGRSYWLYDPVRENVIHISDRLIHEYVFLYAGSHPEASANENKVLNRYWMPLIRKKVEFQRKASELFNKWSEENMNSYQRRKAKREALGLKEKRKEQPNQG